MLRILALALVCVAVLEGIALWKGIDGAALGVAFAAIGAILGWGLKWLKETARRNNDKQRRR